MSTETLKSLLKKYLKRRGDRVLGCCGPRSQVSLEKIGAEGEEGQLNGYENFNLFLSKACINIISNSQYLNSWLREA